MVSKVCSGLTLTPQYRHVYLHFLFCYNYQNCWTAWLWVPGPDIVLHISGPLYMLVPNQKYLSSYFHIMSLVQKAFSHPCFPTQFPPSNWELLGFSNTAFSFILSLSLPPSLPAAPYMHTHISLEFPSLVYFSAPSIRLWASWGEGLSLISVMFNT